MCQTCQDGESDRDNGNLGDDSIRRCRDNAVPRATCFVVGCPKGLKRQTMPKKEVFMLDISAIKYDGTQSREKINTETVAEYAEQIENGADFPPVVVFYDGVTFWLADGFHRFLAHVKAGKEKIREQVIPGDKRAAILYSAGANHTHGLRRTNADKRKSVAMLLSDTEWSQWSDYAIAEACKVDRRIVADVRKSLSSTNVLDSTARKTVRNGTEYTMDTGGIGRPAAPVKTDPAPVGSVLMMYDPADLMSVDIQSSEFSEPKLTREQELEQQITELRDILSDTDKALRDAMGEGSDGYVSEITKLRHELDVVKISRNALQNENSYLKKQIAALESKIKNMRDQK